MRGADDDLRRLGRGSKLERRLVERQPVVLAGDAERLAEPARARAEQARVVEPAPLPHHVEAAGRLERAEQDALASSPGPQTRFRHQWMP